MKKTLLTAAILLAGIGGMNAAPGPAVTEKDPATYEPNVAAGVYAFTSDWFVSPLTGNFNTANYPFAVADDWTRSMTYANGKLYFGRRVYEGLGTTAVLKSFAIDVVDAKTGAFIKTVNLPENVFKSGEALLGYGLNTLCTDSEGNLVMINMVLNIQTAVLQVWAMKDENDTPKLILDYEPVMLGNGDIPTLRMDFLDVYGDVYGDGYIIGAASGADPIIGKMVLKWDIVDGVGQVDQYGEPNIIELGGFVPAQAFNGNPVVALGSASYVKTVSENTFFVDGQNTYPTMYDMEGQIVTGKSFADVAETVAKPNTSANGVKEVKLDETHFLLTGATPNVASGDYKNNSFNLYKLGAGGNFAGMELAYTFPKEGLGANANGSFVVRPFVVDQGNGLADVYVFAMNNGFAKYTLQYREVPDGIEKIAGEKGVIASYAAGAFDFSSEVASVEVYSIAGVQVAAAKNVTTLPAALLQGVYIVKATSLDGVVSAQKVSVK